MRRLLSAPCAHHHQHACHRFVIGVSRTHPKCQAALTCVLLCLPRPLEPTLWVPQATGVRAENALDAIITNVLIVDYWGIVKADVGLKGNKIVGIGKGGNPDVMDGVAESMVVGVSALYQRCDSLFAVDTAAS